MILATYLKVRRTAHSYLALGSRFRKNAEGATAVEYGLLAGLMALGILGGIGALSDLVNLLFEVITEETTAVADNINSDG